MKYINSIFAIAILVVATHASAARRADLYDPEKIIITLQNSPVTAADVRNKIVAAAQQIGWRVIADDTGRLELHYDKNGKHQVNIEVVYDQFGYDINYIRSNNLNYREDAGKKEIHPTYNRWITNLMDQIGSFN